MNNFYVLGIDIGTSATKTVLVNRTGKVVAETSFSYPVITPKPNWFEQDPEDWWIAVKNTVKILLSNFSEKEKIVGIGLSGQMHGLVPLDSNFRVVRPSIIWSDQRNYDQCLKIYKKCGGINNLRKFTNNRMLAGFTGGKLLWFMEKEPHLYQTTKIFLLPKDYIRFRLTGEISTDVSDASGTGLFDVCTRQWSSELITLLGFEKSMFPEVVESIEITGTTKPDLSDEIGLPAGIPVVGGGGDAVIAMIGSGVVDRNVLGISIGTGGVVATSTNTCEENPESLLQVSCHNISHKWHKMGVSMGAGGALTWIKDLLYQTESDVAKHTNQDEYELLLHEASLVPPGSNGLLFLPHLYGSRCPNDDSNSRAALIGLTSKHSKGDIIRSVLEGVIYNIKEISELIYMNSQKPEHIILSGGGSRSNLWRQITADVFNQKIFTVNTSKYGSAYGAAIIAGLGTGAWDNISQPLNNIRTESENNPIEENHLIYNNYFATYKKIYPSIRGIYND